MSSPKHAALREAGFHPITAEWFADRFGGPTEAQRRGWPAIRKGRDTLIAAPTGSGKTLAAFLVCLDRLIAKADGDGDDHSGNDGVRVLYVSPLKALSNDIERNLREPLAELRDRGAPAIRAMIRTGDTPQAERQAMVKQPPDVLVTTPESLYLLLTSAGGRRILGHVETVIVDEIHALARDKRGVHLALSLERLEWLTKRTTGRRPQRIGLSATQRPIERIASFLSGSNPVDIIDGGHARELDLGVVVPPAPLSAVCTHETWEEIYEQLATLIESHRSTLIFVNTRRLAERVTHRLSERLGHDRIASHHGSLARKTRLEAERRLKAGELKAIVATASLELGIDVGFIDLVCQLASPRSIAAFLQRVGRSGHALGLTPKGRLFPLTRDDQLECFAMIRATRAGTLDAIDLPRNALDILAQQVIAEVAAVTKGGDDVGEDELFARVTNAWSYRDLSRDVFDQLIEMLSDGVAGTRRRAAYLHRDAVNRRLRARRRAHLAAITAGGAIPETGDYRVVTEGDKTYVGSVNEDFAIESSGGDVFLLGNTSWRIRRVKGNEVVVVDAEGAAATVPFWFGEAPGRSIELSTALSDLRTEIAGREPENAAAWLIEACGADAHGAQQAVHYVHAQHEALGVVPSLQHVVFERFFDESGGMQLVIHAPFGARINRAWGLALRKRFCRSFDFELQAAADENGIVLSLGPQHSFAIERMFTMLTPKNGEALLRQALLASPMFGVRWRWNATRALAILRQFGGKRNPPQRQRMQAEDLLAAIFPDQTGCLENHHGDVEIPSHPLVDQTVADCMHEGMDVDRWLDVLRSIEAGTIRLIAKDTREPSPFSHELLNANPYAFLDDAPLEERRARAVQTRRSLDVDQLRDLCALDPAAIDRVRQETWPIVRDADELHDALLVMGALPESDGAAWLTWFEQLVTVGRATRLGALWVAAERLALVQAAFPERVPTPPLAPVHARAASSTDAPTASTAWVALVRGRLECTGPVTAERLATDLGLPSNAVGAALDALEGEGFAMRGSFTDPEITEWCERRLLARIHRLTLEGLRKRIRPVPPAAFLRHLLDRHHLTGDHRLAGRRGLTRALDGLQGFDVAAGAWESILAARVTDYDPDWLDDAILRGELVWGRLDPPATGARRSTVSRTVPIAFSNHDALALLMPSGRRIDETTMRSDAATVHGLLRTRGALFAADLERLAGLLPTQLENALMELVALGAITADRFEPIRHLARDTRRTPALLRRRGGTPGSRTLGRAAWCEGRWSIFGPVAPDGLDESSPEDMTDAALERWAHQLIARYGIVFRDLLTRETHAPRWGTLVPVLRRMEAVGTLRGGRFVEGVGGEQFADPSVIPALRDARDVTGSGEWVVASAADPVNLVGIVTPGPRVPAIHSNRIAFQGGVPRAWRQGDAIHGPDGDVDLATLPTEVRAALESRRRYPGDARPLRSVGDER